MTNHTISTFIAFLILTAIHISFAQTGLINDDFSTGQSHGWGKANSINDSFPVVNGKLIVATGPDTGNRWGTLKKASGITVHAGNYPIVAVRMRKPPKCNFFFDTPLGSYNATNNNFVKIAMPDSNNIYYYDLSKGTLGSTTVSTTSSTTLGFVQFKVAEIILTSAQLANHDTTYPVSWVRTYPSVDSLRYNVQPEYFTRPTYSHPFAFVHPGLLHDTADFERMKRLIAKKELRAYASYLKLIADPRSSTNYAIRGPYTQLTRDASLTIDGVGGGTIHGNVESDVMAAYYNAVLWQITDDVAHASKAIAIINAYSSTTTSIAGADAALNGLYGFMLCNAAEILRSSGSGWTSAEITRFQTMLKNVFYPVLQNFVPCAHGNWDIISMKCLLAIAILCDDHAMYDKVINYFHYGEGNGSIGNYVVSDAGQLQESNRDQPHSMLALGCLCELAEMALKQGDDLYAVNNQAIRRGYEYLASYNLGNTVPYVIHYDYCERNFKDYTPESISPNGRGNFRSVFEIAWNRYAVANKSPMPWTLAVMDSMGAEGAPFGADNPGYGSLFFRRDSTDVSTHFPGHKKTGMPGKSLGYRFKNGNLVLWGAESRKHVEIFDIAGRKVADQIFTGYTSLWLGKKSGIYLIKINNNPAITVIAY